MVLHCARSQSTTFDAGGQTARTTAGIFLLCGGVHVEHSTLVWPSLSFPLHHLPPTLYDHTSSAISYIDRERQEEEAKLMRRKCAKSIYELSTRCAKHGRVGVEN